jgi:uncharacterized membrane protein
MPINELLPWYLTLQLFALAGLPLAFAWLRRLPSRGYAAAKVLGLLLSGVLFWWGGILQVWNTTPGAALTAAAILLLVGLWKMRGHWAEVRPWWQTHRAFVITTEVLFLAAFLLWATVRATQPQIATTGGEKWMEIAFLNAVLRSPTMPPHDPWLSGYAISYYYLGYLLLAMLTQLSGLPGAIAFNLGNAAWFALAAVGAYGVLYDLRKTSRPGAALLAPLLLLLTGGWIFAASPPRQIPPSGSPPSNSIGGAPPAPSTITPPSAPPPTPSTKKSLTSSPPSASS